MIDNMNYILEGKYGESNASSAWKEYTSSHVELQEYNSDWPRIYQDESNQIKVSELITLEANSLKRR